MLLVISLCRGATLFWRTLLLETDCKRGQLEPLIFFTRAMNHLSIRHPLHSPSYTEKANAWAIVIGECFQVLVYCALRRPTCVADNWTELFWSGMLKLLFGYSAVTHCPEQLLAYSRLSPSLQSSLITMLNAVCALMISRISSVSSRHCSGKCHVCGKQSKMPCLRKTATAMHQSLTGSSLLRQQASRSSPPCLDVPRNQWSRTRSPAPAQQSPECCRLGTGCSSPGRTRSRALHNGSICEPCKLR